METPTCTVALEAEPLDCCISPSSYLLAAGLVNGQLHLASFACEQRAAAPAAAATASTLSSKAQHTIAAPSTSADAAADAPSCRALCFSSGGAAVLAGYADHAVRLYDATTGKLTTVYEGEHDAQLSRLLAVDEQVFASGDEDGLVLLWDARAARPVYSYKKHTEYVTDFALHAKNQALLVVSGDGTLSVHDLRKRKALARSEDDADDELLSCAVVKGGKKVVAGTQSGVLHIYSWGYFNDCSDRFPGHPESVQALVAFDEDTLLTGSSDGGVRVVGVLPNRLLGILGQHHEDLPLERLALSADRRVLASVSHNAVVKLWDLSILHEDDDDGEEDDEKGAPDSGDDKGGAAHAGGGGEEAEEEVGGSDSEGSSEDGSEDRSDDSGEWETTEGEEGPSGSGAEAEAPDSQGAGAGAGPKSKKRSGAAAKERSASGAAAGGSGRRASAEPSAKGREGSKPAASKGGGEASAAAAATAGGGGGDDGTGSDGDGSDSDGDGGSRKRKRTQRERTRWNKGTEQKKKPAANFFAGLL